MDKIVYKSKMHELLNNESKFRQLSSGQKNLGEGQLQRYLRDII